MENVEKILCCDRGGNDNNMWPMAAMMNGGMGGNGMWNNPFVYLVWMMFAGRFFGNGNGWGDGNGQGAQNIEVQAQLSALREQMSSNQNSNLIMDAIKGNQGAISQLASQLNCDFNTLNSAICDVRGGVDRLAGQVGFSAERVINAVNLGDCGIISQLKDCCCEQKELTQRMGYENQLGQKDIQFTTQRGFCDLGNALERGLAYTNTGIERGFSQTAYATQQQTCDIINAINASQQRTSDLLNGHWSQEQANKIQDLKFELSQERQNNLIISRLGGYYGGYNGCGCNNGCAGF